MEKSVGLDREALPTTSGAKEIRGASVLHAMGRAGGIDGHAADRIAGKLGHGGHRRIPYPVRREVSMAC